MIDKWIPILLEKGFLNPVLRFEIKLNEGLTEDSIAIDYTGVSSTSQMFNKAFVNQSVVLADLCDIQNKIFNELFSFAYNKNI